MNPKRSIRSAFIAVTLSSVALGGAISACTDQLVSIGDSGDSGVGDAGRPDESFVCPGAFAHPNLCCQSDGMGGSPICSTPSAHPFDPCMGGRSTVVNTASCCPRDSNGSGLAPYPAGCFQCSPSGTCKPRDGAPLPTDASPPLCDPHNDFTCNDDPTAPSPRGKCVDDGRTCECSPQSPKNLQTGRCE